jgi:hypothetical protein
LLPSDSPLEERCTIAISGEICREYTTIQPFLSPYAHRGGRVARVLILSRTVFREISAVFASFREILGVPEDAGFAVV